MDAQQAGELRRQAARGTVLQVPPSDRVAREEGGGWFPLLLSSESLRYFVLILVLVWAVIYIKTGAEGVDAIRDAAASMVTGGAR